MDIDASLRELAADHHSGATALTARLAGLLREALNQGGPTDEQLWAMVNAQPSMASVLNLVNWALLEAQSGGGNRAARKLDTYVRSLERRVRLSAGRAARLLQGQDLVVTYSSSSTVMAALEMRASALRRPRLVLSEGRPAGEGLTAAAALAGLGYSVRLVVDAALFAELEGAGLVLVGADALGPPGLVNKIGTRGLARAAQAEGVPFAAVATTDKMLPPTLWPFLRIVEHDPAEVFPQPPSGVDVENRYYDFTPWEAVDTVVTEDGVFTPADLLERIAEVPVAARLEELRKSL
ncbi:MAG: hypothetical protein C4524_04990 [Candidatus Zixiibacteriota bacterium]|nr:MAG: hypothetical protein C4524_04990 [candidate division Zixibacteria bacterium]